MQPNTTEPGKMERALGDQAMVPWAAAACASHPVTEDEALMIALGLGDAVAARPHPPSETTAKLTDLSN